MNRRHALKTILAASAGTSVFRSSPMLAQDATSATAVGTIYLHPAKGSDTSSGTKDSPLKTLAAAAKRVSESTGSDAVTIILSEGVYAVGETAVFKPVSRSFTKDNRLIIRAEVLPDDPEWNPGRMPTLIHTMPLSPDWNGRPDPFGGVAYGMMIETSHVTIQGLKILGMPVVEHPKQGAIHRVYPIGRNGRDLDDLEIKQCLFAGDEVTNPNHLGILANGSGIVVDHCIFYHLKRLRHLDLRYRQRFRLPQQHRRGLTLYLDLPGCAVRSGRIRAGRTWTRRRLSRVGSLQGDRQSVHRE